MRPAENIERFVRDTTITTNPQVNDAVLKDLLDRLDEAAGVPADADQPSIWRIIMKNNAFRVAAAAAMIAIVALVGMQFVGGTSAYAQIVRQIKVARTVAFTLIKQSNTGDRKTVRIDVVYKEPGHLRTTTVDGYVCVLDANAGKMVSIIPQRMYSTGDLSSLPKSDDSGPFVDIEAMKGLPAEADRELGSKEIDGIRCDGYQVTQGDMTTTVWLDAKAGEVVQIELKYATAPGMNTIIKNIQLDIPLEDSLFSLAPPAGYKELGPEVKSDTTAQTEAKFIEWLGWWTDSTIDGTFPPMVAGVEIAKAIMDMGREGKLKGEAWQKSDVNQRMFNALLFVGTLPPESNWRYAGNGVKINTPNTPIFWYRPVGSEIYRVIYADLTIREEAEEDLPK